MTAYPTLPSLFRFFKEPLSALAVMLLWMNLVVPGAALSATTICAGDGSGIAVILVDQNGQQAPAQDDLNHCPLCLLVAEDFQLISAGERDGTELQPAFLPVRYFDREATVLRNGKRLAPGARAPPFV